MDRFPADDFMFELTENEIGVVVSQNVIPHKKYLGGAMPFAFTETGVAMLLPRTLIGFTRQKEDEK